MKINTACGAEISLAVPIGAADAKNLEFLPRKSVFHQDFRGGAAAPRSHATAGRLSFHI